MAAAAAAILIANHHFLLSRPSLFLSKLLSPSSLIRGNLPSSFPSRFCCTRSSHTQFPTTSSSSLIHEVFEDDDDEEEEDELELDDFTAHPKQKPTSAPITDSIRTAITGPVSSSSLPLPNLSVKEKKELASFAHSLGKKLKCQQVGKSGVTSSVAAAFVENLESNELLKLKVHNSCPGEMDDVVKQLEESTGSVAVGQIGRTVILYRPSLTKLNAAEKKKENAEKMRKRSFLRSRASRQPGLYDVDLNQIVTSTQATPDFIYLGKLAKHNPHRPYAEYSHVGRLFALAKVRVQKSPGRGYRRGRQT